MGSMVRKHLELARKDEDWHDEQKMFFEEGADFFPQEEIRAVQFSRRRAYESRNLAQSSVLQERAAVVPTSHNPPHTHSLPRGPSQTNRNP